MSVKIILETPEGQIDVTNRTPAIYGAGVGFTWLHTEILRRAQFVVDSDPAKWGTTLTVHNREMQIIPPEHIATLDPAASYIVISAGNDQYIAEMKETIAHIAGEGKLLTAVKTKDLFVRYDSLEELFSQDAYFQNRMDRSIPAPQQPTVLEKCREIIAEICIEPVEWASPAEGGSGCNFLFGSADRAYFFKLPKGGSSERRREITHAKAAYGLEKGLTLYEDSDGFCLQRRADGAPDFRSDEAVRQVLRKLRSLHETGGKISIERSIPGEYRWLLSRAKETAGSSQTVYLNTLDERLKDALAFCERIKTEERKMSHGDLYWANILSVEGKPYFIDWEMMAMMDPLYDVGYFLYFIPCEETALQRNFKRYLSYYYGRACTSGELRYACAMFAVIAGMQLCFFFLHIASDLAFWTQAAEDRILTRTFRILDLFTG